MIGLPGLKFSTGHSRLTNDRLQSADAYFLMVGNGNGDGAARGFLLHDDVAAAPANLFKAGVCQDRANLSP